jgi:outer membrane immunogenic protein
MYKRLLLAGAASALVAAPALAADMPTPVYTPSPVAAPSPIFYDWTGVYAGVTAGYAWGKYGMNVPSHTFSGNGFMVGGTLGSNWQVDQLVFGLEGDWSWAGMDGRTAIVAPMVSAENRWFGTMRGRLGFAVDQIMLYGTGGLAFTSIKGFDTAGFSSTNMHTGWTLGTGIEAGMTENVSVKVEYLYADFGNKTYNLANGPRRIDNSSHIIRAGVNYRFSW